MRFNKLLGLGIALLTCVFTCISAYAQMAEGLNLEETKEKVVKEEMTPNIHLQLGCEICHAEVPKEGLLAKTMPPLITPDNDMIALCNTCHEGSNLHPVNMDPAKGTPPLTIPATFPLPKEGANKGVITCVTCHYVHSETSGSKLLRGMSQFPGDPKVEFESRIDMCRACHGPDLAKKSPHKKENLKACSFCHSSDPNKAADVEKTIKGDVVQLCNFCHAKLKGAHFLRYNPFADELLKDEIKKADLLMVRGQYTCVTCHDQHGESTQPHFLRDEFIKVAVKSKRIYPHYTQVFCLSCHDRLLKEGEKPTFKFDKIQEVCDWCHSTKEARGQIHPMGRIPPTKDDEKRFKLTQVPENGLDGTGRHLNAEGKLSCETCHQRECKQDVAKTGAKFLRGAPYAKRNDICFRCHIREEFQKLNPHKNSYKKVDDKIIVNESNCVFCHSSVPTKIVEGMESSVTMDFKGDLVFLCIRCHPESPHPGTDIKTGLGVNHLMIYPPKGNNDKKVRPLAQVDTKLLPLDDTGRITCSTCHMPHEPGLVEGARGQIKGQQIQRADVMKGELCDICHAW